MRNYREGSPESFGVLLSASRVVDSTVELYIIVDAGDLERYIGPWERHDCRGADTLAGLILIISSALLTMGALRPTPSSVKEL